mmetsp:Transcript_14019/g.28748  ORF Transcript_14019/g.28748 Transcript_14019/m.28748 type:complete len:281 (-) Transcript_14019:229-1071(-)
MLSSSNSKPMSSTHFLNCLLVKKSSSSLSALLKALLTLGLSPLLLIFLSCFWISFFISSLLMVSSSLSSSLSSSSSSLSSPPPVLILENLSNSCQLMRSSPSSSSLSISLESCPDVNSKPILVKAFLNSLVDSVPSSFLSNVLNTVLSLGLLFPPLPILLISFLTMAAKSPSFLLFFSLFFFLDLDLTSSSSSSFSSSSTSLSSSPSPSPSAFKNSLYLIFPILLLLNLSIKAELSLLVRLTLRSFLTPCLNSSSSMSPLPSLSKNLKLLLALTPFSSAF